jgi:hypothetical protein
MSMQKLSNVPLRDYRDFLKKTGCKYQRTEGGHELWGRNDLKRSIQFQTHVDPVPEFVIKNGLRTLGLTKQDFFNILFDVKT